MSRIQGSLRIPTLPARDAVIVPCRLGDNWPARSKTKISTEALFLMWRSHAQVQRSVSILAIAIALGIGCGLFASSAFAGKDTTLNPKLVQPRVVQQAEPFTVVGISARTSNAKEMTAEGVIGKEWGRLMQEGLLAKIPNKADGNIIAVYTDYASDKNGEYTFVLGAKVKGTGEVPTGMVATTIPAGRYAVFTSERGPGYQVVPQAWQRINSLPKAATGGDRVYHADFEVYDERARNPQDSVVDVYVGIR
jgi:predicted transcriptional regulator YdeE